MEIGDPLPSARRDVEVADRALDMGRHAAPIELRIQIGEIGRRRVAELLVHPRLLRIRNKAHWLSADNADRRADQ